MSGHPDVQDLGRALSADPRARRRLIAGSALRILAMTSGLLVVYALVPVPGSSGFGALVAMLGGLVIVVILVGWQIRTIARARHPVLRAVEVVASALPLLAVVFAFIYLSVSRADASSFSEQLDRVAALYYTVSTISTVGFGDIAARSDAARILVTVQMLFDLALLAALVRLIIIATRTRLRRQGITVDEPRHQGY
jgi:voltage-gated potassium channel